MTHVCVHWVAWHTVSCPDFLSFGLCVLCLGDVHMYCVDV